MAVCGRGMRLLGATVAPGLALGGVMRCGRREGGRAATEVGGRWQ
jgi:hypothetical protein